MNHNETLRRVFTLKNHPLMRAFTLVLVWMTAQMALADSFLVYSVIGNVKQTNGNKQIALAARTTIQSETRLTIGKESAVTVIDERNNKLYSFTTTGTNSVKTLLAKAKGGKSLTKQYASYLVKNLFSKESSKLSHPSSYMQTAAAAYRSTATDSLLLNKIAYLKNEHHTNTVEEAIVQEQTHVIGDLDVRFELVSCLTGLPIGKEVEPNTSCYVKIYNNTKEALYVNILDIDEHGNKYLVLPVDDAALCAHLLVPAESTVCFTSEPFEFVEAKTKEAFLLVATEEPVDFCILMNPIEGSGNKHLKSGLYRNVYETK